ncbi:MAG: ribosome assembly RNA-binding protein YhbY [Lachnospiraceae bacterium]|nr:ribosome assembly RNA-binding protein YhbY [Lachnospiraceae bacterium]
MTSKQRAFLKGQASLQDTILHVGKEGVSPELVKAADEALEARELIKVGLLKNCTDDVKNVAEMLSGRTRSVVVHTIGKKIVLYRPKKDKPVLLLPL